MEPVGQQELDIFSELRNSHYGRRIHMRKCAALVLALICVLGLTGCNKKSMNYIISNEPSISGIVEEVNENSILIYIQTDGYPYGADCSVSLDVENADGLYSPITVGDEVVVYYDGSIAESDPLQISTVYAITLKTPADRSVNDQS